MNALTARQESNRKNADKNKDLIDKIATLIKSACEKGNYQIIIEDNLDDYTKSLLISMGYKIEQSLRDKIITIISW